MAVPSPRQPRLNIRSWALACLLSATSCVGFGLESDLEPELIKQSGARAVVTLGHDAFAMTRGMGSRALPPETDPGSLPQTLAGRFTEALEASGAFHLAPNPSWPEARHTPTIVHGTMTKAVPSPVRLDPGPPTLVLECHTTKLQFGEIESSGDGWRNHTGWARLARPTRYVCELRIDVVDRITGLCVASAVGSGWAKTPREDPAPQGTPSTSAHAPSEDMLKTAIQHAITRAVNELASKVPKDYFAQP